MRGSHDPFEQMEAMFEQMRRSALGSRAGPGRPALGEYNRPPLALGDGQRRGGGLTLEETDDGYLVVADLPGFEREEIDLTYDDGVLSIQCSHEVTEDEEYRRRTASESVHVPGEIAVDDVTATYRNGVLEVVLPVDEETTDEYTIDVE